MPGWSEISVTVTVKNGMPSILKLIQSIPKEAEIIVVDTGSSDDTINAVKKAGVKLIEKTWPNDFAAGRNQAIRQGTREFILNLDADEYLDLKSVKEIEKLDMDGKSAAIFFQVNLDLNGKEISRASLIRFFRNRKEIFFEGAIHEQVRSSINSFNKDSGMEIAETKINFYHTGYADNDEEFKRKIKRNRDILLEELKTDPENSFKLYNLGKMDRDIEPEKAFNILFKVQRKLLNNGQFTSYTTDLWHHIIHIFFKKIGDPSVILNDLKAWLQIRPGNPALWYYCGQVLEAENQEAAANACYNASADHDPDPEDGYHPQPGYKTKSLCSMARLAIAKGENDLAISFIKEAKKDKNSLEYIQQIEALMSKSL